MPPQVVKSPVNLNQALKASSSRAMEEKQEFTNLPGGIEGGVARLIEAKLGKYQKGENEGQQFVYLAATVIEPKTATRITKMWDANANNGKGGVKIVGNPKEVKVYGQRTSVMLPLCATKKNTKEGEVIVSAQDNVNIMMGELQLLGGEECIRGVEDDADLVNLLNSLKEAGPLTRFSTRDSDPNAKYPNPRVFETWYGNSDLQGYTPGDPGGVVDHSANGVASGPDSNPEGFPEAGATDLAQSDDLDALAAAADGEAGSEQGDAVDRLTALAKEAGIDEDTIRGTTSWTECAALITEAQAAAAGGDTPPAEPEAKEWKKGDTCKYTPIDPKSKKPMLNARTKKPIQVQCEITAVDKKAGTVDLLSLADKKTKYPKVKLDALIEE